MTQNEQSVLMVFGCIFMIALFIAGPFLLIWAINTLVHGTGFVIAYTGWNWLAAFSVMICLRSVTTSSNK